MDMIYAHETASNCLKLADPEHTALQAHSVSFESLISANNIKTELQWATMDAPRHDMASEPFVKLRKACFSEQIQLDNKCLKLEKGTVQNRSDICSEQPFLMDVGRGLERNLVAIQVTYEHLNTNDTFREKV